MNENINDFIGNIDKNVLAKIKQIRKEKGFSQKQVADFLGISQATYSDIELGRIELNLKRFIALVKYLDIKDVFVENQNVSNDLVVIDNFESFLEKFLQQNQAIIQLQTNDEKLQQDVSEIKSLLQEILTKLNEKP